MTEEIEVAEDNDELTPEEEAAIVKWGLVIGLFFMAVTAGIWWHNNMQDCLDEKFCVAVNGEWNLRVTGQYESINGLSNVYDLAGEIELESGRIVPVEVYASDNDDWSAAIDVESYSVNGISVTDYMDPISLDLVYVIPDLPDSVGETVKLRFTGQVMIPVTEGDDVLSRTFATDMSYEDVVKDVSDESEIILQSAGFGETSRISGWWFWLSLIVGILGLLASLIMRMDDPEEDEEEDAGEAGAEA